MKDKFITLAIESSCDDTAVAVLRGRRELLASLMATQIASHSKYGGVVPELASRMHQEAIIPLLREAFAAAEIKNPAKEIDLVAVTSGPGLMGSLLVGVMTAKALAQAWNVPLVGVNHLEGHIFANVIAHGEELSPPFISVIVSGGHTELVMAKELGRYELIGSTRDDAAGEAYDKLAKALGLGYPGGPVIDKLARAGNPDAHDLPVPLAGTKEIEFSFSGLKTAAMTLIKKEREEGRDLSVENICASFQKAAVESLTRKILLAVKKSGVKKIALSGGVSANSGLRERLEELAKKNKWQVYFPPFSMCTDNAGMIAAAGFHAFQSGRRDDLSLSPDPSWAIW